MIARNWKYDGWTDSDWTKIGDISAKVSETARDLDAKFGGGGGGCPPTDLDSTIADLENSLRLLKEVQSNYF